MIGIKTIINKILDIIELYTKVGAIYITTNSQNPSILFGGTWEQIQGRMLIGSSSTRPVKSTGGSPDEVLASHNHSMGNEWSNGSGSGSAYTFNGSKKPVVQYTAYVGSSGNTIRANLPPYYVVYIWRRVS